MDNHLHINPVLLNWQQFQQQAQQRRSKRWCLGIVAAVAVLALVAAWFAAQPAGQQAGKQGLVRQAEVYSATYADFWRRLGDVADAGWVLQQPNLTAALRDGSSSPLHEQWMSALEQALRPGHRDALHHLEGVAVSQAEGRARERKLLGGGRRSAAAAATLDHMRSRMACQLRLLQLAADFAASWAAQRSMQHPLPGSGSDGQEQPVQQAEVELMVGHARNWLLIAHGILSKAASSMQHELAVTMVALQLAAQYGARTMGWRWSDVDSSMQAAQQQFGAAWWQPAAGQQQCWEEWAVLRPLYKRGGWGRDGTQPDWWQLGSSPQASVVELLETGTLGNWVQHLAAKAYGDSSAADVAMVAGELAVLPDRRAVAWALPDDLPLARESSFWSPAFALGDTFWRLVVLFHGACLHLALMPDRPLSRAARLRVGAISLADVDAARSMSAKLPAPPFCLPPYFATTGAPLFEVAWASPYPDATFLEHNGPEPTTLAFAAGEHQHRPLPGCWLMPQRTASAASRPQPWWERAGRGGQQQPVTSWKLLAVAQVEMLQPSGSSAAPAAPASPLPPIPAGNGTGVVLGSSRYARLLSHQQQLEWRLPPAAPGFNSSLLRQPELPELVDAVLAVAGSSADTCPWRSTVYHPPVSSFQNKIVTLTAQMVPGLDEAAMRRSRMALTTPHDSGSSGRHGWRGWYAACRHYMRWSLGSLVEEALVHLLRALRSRFARGAAGLALVLLLAHQGLLAWQLLVAGFWYARWARQGAAGLAAAPLLPALLPQLRRLPCAAVRRALQMAQRLKGWDPTELTFDLLVITIAWPYGVWPIAATCLLVMAGAFKEGERAPLDVRFAVILDRMGRLLCFTAASSAAVVVSATYQLFKFDMGWQEDAHDSSWLDRAWNWLLSPATLTLIAAPVAGLHFAYNERFHPAARWAFQAVAAAYVAGQLCFRVACAFNLFMCTQLFGCTGPAALLAGCGPLLVVLAPLLWGQWVRIIGTVAWGRRMAADAQAAAAWERARRFGSAFWPFDLVHAVLCRLARALESAGWQQPEAAGAERAVPEPAPALWPTGSSWLQRLRHVYMLQPELFKCPHAGLTLRPWRLLPAAWRALTLGFVAEVAFTAFVTVPFKAAVHLGMTLLVLVLATAYCTAWAVFALPKIFRLIFQDWLPEAAEQQGRPSLLLAVLQRVAEAVEALPNVAVQTLAAVKRLWSLWFAYRQRQRQRAQERRRQQQQARQQAQQARQQAQQARQQQRAQQQAGGQKTKTGQADGAPASGSRPSSASTLRPSSASGSGAPQQQPGSRSGAAAAEAGREAAATEPAGRLSWWPLRRRQTVPAGAAAEEAGTSAAAAQPQVQRGQTQQQRQQQPRPPSAEQQPAAAGLSRSASGQSSQSEVPAGGGKKKRGKRQQQQQQQSQPQQAAAGAQPPLSPSGKWETVGQRKAREAQQQGANVQPQDDSQRRQQRQARQEAEEPPAAPSAQRQVRYWQVAEEVLQRGGPQTVQPQPQQAAPSAAAYPLPVPLQPQQQPQPAAVPAPAPLPLPIPLPLAPGQAPAQQAVSAVPEPVPLPPPAVVEASSMAAAEPPAWDADAAAATAALAAASRAPPRPATDLECVWCLDAPRETTLAPCGHRVLCLGCTRRLRTNATPAAPALCPVCREEVESYIRREFLA